MPRDHASALDPTPRLSRLTEGVEGGLQVADRRLDALLDVTPLHRLTTITRAGHHFGVCSCGFVSTGYLTEGDALAGGCEVEALLAESVLRRARLQLGVER